MEFWSTSNFKSRSETKPLRCRTAGTVVPSSFSLPSKTRSTMTRRRGIQPISQLFRPKQQKEEERTIGHGNAHRHLAASLRPLLGAIRLARLPDRHLGEIPTPHDARLFLLPLADGLAAAFGPLAEIVDKELEAVESRLVERSAEEGHLELDRGRAESEGWRKGGFGIGAGRGGRGKGGEGDEGRCSSAYVRRILS